MIELSSCPSIYSPFARFFVPIVHGVNRFAQLCAGSLVNAARVYAHPFLSTAPGEVATFEYFLVTSSVFVLPFDVFFEVDLRVIPTVRENCILWRVSRTFNLESLRIKKTYGTDFNARQRVARCFKSYERG